MSEFKPVERRWAAVTALLCTVMLGCGDDAGDGGETATGAAADDGATQSSTGGVPTGAAGEGSSSGEEDCPAPSEEAAAEDGTSGNEEMAAEETCEPSSNSPTEPASEGIDNSQAAEPGPDVLWLIDQETTAAEVCDDDDGSPPLTWRRGEAGERYAIVLTEGEAILWIAYDLTMPELTANVPPGAEIIHDGEVAGRQHPVPDTMPPDPPESPTADPQPMYHRPSCEPGSRFDFTLYVLPDEEVVLDQGLEATAAVSELDARASQKTVLSISIPMPP